MNLIIHMFHTYVTPYVSLDQYLNRNVYTIPNMQNMRFLLQSSIPGGGGGGYSNFFRIRRQHLPFTPKQYREFQAPQKNIWNFSKPKKISQFCTLTLKKTLNLLRNDPQTSPILWWPNKNTPKKYSFFWKPKKVLKFRILNPQKWVEPTYVWKYQSTPPLGPVYI